MTFLTQDKTNWKYIIIVLILAVIVGVITWQYLLKPQPWSYLIEPTENETEKFLGDESKWEDIKIELKDIQGLFGGRNISISGKGETIVEIAMLGLEGLDTKTYNLLLSELEIKEIINTFIKNDFITIIAEERSGIPDEARPKIILTNAEGNQYKIAVWGNDLQENDRFLNIYQELLLIEKKAETADWKTYESLKVGFSIKCPPELEVQLDVPSSAVRSPYKTIISLPGTKTGKGMQIEIESIYPQKVDPWREGEYIPFQDFTEIEKEFFVSTPEEEDIIIEGVSGKKLYLVDENGLGFAILLEKGNKYYKIGGIIWADSQNIYLPIFNQILSTFRFLE